eukprot:TRINITY_DN112_c0_g1_i1.p1 TRINITY_DN112_c0_g1~~TRINITY_DN112_c0_g1_i1.p1  ORF type:complete len:504 (+),score=145.61 TRINITY_DN112_c0_g1_i1:34-1512(+)
MEATLNSFFDFDCAIYTQKHNGPPSSLSIGSLLEQRQALLAALSLCGSSGVKEQTKSRQLNSMTNSEGNVKEEEEEEEEEEGEQAKEKDDQERAIDNDHRTKHEKARNQTEENNKADESAEIARRRKELLAKLQGDNIEEKDTEEKDTHQQQKQKTQSEDEGEDEDHDRAEEKVEEEHQVREDKKEFELQEQEKERDQEDSIQPDSASQYRTHQQSIEANTNASTLDRRHHHQQQQNTRASSSTAPSSVLYSYPSYSSSCFAAPSSADDNDSSSLPSSSSSTSSSLSAERKLNKKGGIRKTLIDNSNTTPSSHQFHQPIQQKSKPAITKTNGGKRKEDREDSSTQSGPTAEPILQQAFPSIAPSYSYSSTPSFFSPSLSSPYPCFPTQPSTSNSCVNNNMQYSYPYYPSYGQMPLQSFDQPPPSFYPSSLCYSAPVPSQQQPLQQQFFPPSYQSTSSSSIPPKDEALANLLYSWFQAGYYSGYYTGLTARKQ